MLGDPVEVAALAGSLGQGREQSNPLLIGSVRGQPGNLDNFFDGLIDETAVYNRVLSPTEIQNIVSAGGAGKGAGSTITQDVPADALAVARAKQEVRPDGAARYRARRRKAKEKDT